MQDDEKCRVAIYCRVGNAGEAADDAALQAQLKIVRAYAASLGFSGCGEYVDDGYSGFSADRPGFARLNEDIRAGRVQAIFVQDEARICRNVPSFLAWLDEMLGLGVDVYTLRGRIGGSYSLLGESVRVLGSIGGCG